MAAVETGPADIPAGLDELVARLLELHQLQLHSPAIRRTGGPARGCRCDHPLVIRDDWFPSWTRCLKCGRDLR
jgi:hypothetical protein